MNTHWISVANIWWMWAYLHFELQVVLFKRLKSMEWKKKKHLMNSWTPVKMLQIFSWFSFWLFILCAADDVYHLDDYHLQRNVKYSVAHSKEIHFLCFLLFNIFLIVILFPYNAALTADTKTPESSGSDFSSLLARSLWFSSCGF